MKLIPQNDKWRVNAGKITREQRDEMLEWCHKNWTSGWGEVDTSLGETVFIFPQLSQANWFMLKWA
jgi:hypothetical protein